MCKEHYLLSKFCPPRMSVFRNLTLNLTDPPFISLWGKFTSVTVNLNGFHAEVIAYEVLLTVFIKWSLLYP